LESTQAFEQDLVGAHLGKYEIVEEVGYGGMSVVYRAHDSVLDREVALKVLHAHLSKRPDARKRFEREARAVAKLKHPNIVEIYDFSEDDAHQSYIVTEFIRGPTLRQFIEARKVSFPEIGVLITIPLLDALSHAHEFGVLHRDVKPENVMIRPDGVVKLMDFGIARVRDSARMTETGSLLGSPAHMAPEVVSGEIPDFRSDIFSVGTVLYFLSTGFLPFEGRNAAVLLRAIADGKYVDPEIRDARIGKRLGVIIRKCLERDREERYQTIAEVRDDLRSYVEELGVENVRKELATYFAGPEEYETALRVRLLVMLEERGRQALEDKQIARAVDYFNRVLAIDDAHEGVRRLLGRLDRRRRWMGYGVGVAGLIVVSLVLALAMGLFAPGPRPLTQAEVDLEEQRAAESIAASNLLDDTATSLEEASNSLTAALNPAEQLSVAVGATNEALAEARASSVGAHVAEAVVVVEAMAIAANVDSDEPDDDEPVDERGDGDQSNDEIATAESERVMVRLSINPRNAFITVDGEELGELTRYGAGVPMAPGLHEVVYRHPTNAAEPVRQEITVRAGRDIQYARRVAFTPRPSRLIVRSDSPGSVYVPGLPPGRTGETISVPYEEGDRHERDLTITVIFDVGGRDEIEAHCIADRRCVNRDARFLPND
jgi:predicted Ser/Thr protein kinase